MRLLSKIFLLSIILFSCHKSKTKIKLTDSDGFTYIENIIFSLNRECKDSIAELTGINTGYQFFQDTSNIRYVFFNPNNPNEILCYKEYKNQLFILGRNNLKMDSVTNMHLLFPPKWGKNGWILLNNGNIYKIKPDGSDLQQIAIGYNPEWNADGSKFAYDLIHNNKSIGAIYDFNTDIIDTLPFILNAGMCWQNSNNLIVAHSNEEKIGSAFCIADMNSREKKKMLDILSPLPPHWINEKEFVYVYNHKLYSLNIINKTITILAQFCINELPGYFSYSPITNELITVIDHWKSISDYQILITSKIMILNLANHSVNYINL